MSNNNSPAPFRIVGNYSGSPVMLRSYADRVEISFKSTVKSFPNRETAMLFLQSLSRLKSKGGRRETHDFTKQK